MLLLNSGSVEEVPWVASMKAKPMPLPWRVAQSIVPCTPETSIPETVGVADGAVVKLSEPDQGPPIACTSQ